MPIVIDIPEALERELRARTPDLDEEARDRFIIAQYEAARISVGQVALALGFETRLEAEQWLGGRGVFRNYGLEDLEADRRTLAKMLGDREPLKSRGGPR